MGLFEKLSENDKTMIQKYINAYALEECANIRNQASLDHILRVWDGSKSQYLYKMLGEKMDIAKSFKAEKDKDMLQDELDEKLTRYGSAGYEFYSCLNSYCHDRSKSYNDQLWDVLELLRLETLASNLYRGDTFTVNFPNGETLKVNNGCKVSKVLGKIAAGFNISGYEAFRIAHSQVLNEKSFVGEMHLSIHPMDYMTMSDNECGWSSCMSWMEEGEYRRGTIEMMNSVSVVEAYIPASNDMCVPGNFQWNNKKWRQLFIVTPTFITAIKGYPYWNRSLEKVAMDWIKDLAETNLEYGPYINKQYSFHSSDSFEVPELNKRVRFRFYTDAMYCDFCYDHTAYISADIMDEVEFTYSGPSECMCCGSTSEYFSGESTLCCEGCDDRYECYECGDRHYREDMYYVDGSYYCEYCYHDLPICGVCGEVHDSGCMYNICIADDKGLASIETTICENCFNSNAIQSVLKTYEKHWSMYHYIHINDLTDDVAEEFFHYDCRQDIVDELESHSYRFIKFNEAA